MSPNIPPPSLINYTSEDVIKLACELIAQEEINLTRKETTLRSLNMLKSHLNKHVIPWLMTHPIQKINYVSLSECIDYLKRENLSSGTISQYMNVLRKFMKFALNRGKIDSLPTFPSIKNNSSPRGGFTLAEYKQLVGTARRMINQDWFDQFPKNINENWRCKAGGIFTNNQYDISEMPLLIRFMINTFVRPVDIKLIKHEHIQIIRGRNVYLRLMLPETKRHKTQIVSMPIAVNIYERLLKLNLAKGFGKLSDYLFLPEIQNREDAIYIISRDFRKILISADLRYGRHGQGRSLYSLRHTAITNRNIQSR